MYLIESARDLRHIMIGRKLAHYKITSHPGSGGIGDVCQAADSRLGRDVAIKLLPEAFTQRGAAERMRATGFPQVETAAVHLVQSPPETEMVATYARADD